MVNELNQLELLIRFIVKEFEDKHSCKLQVVNKQAENHSMAFGFDDLYQFTIVLDNK
jgi:hypothetical protein